jgi:transposase-like protein
MYKRILKTSPTNGVSPDQQLQTEVTPKAKRRQFSAQYKLRILDEADRCTRPGEIGALLRREGLYSSNLATWRRQRQKGQIGALSPKKRGPKPIGYKLSF